MLIKLKCTNSKCGYAYSITPAELEDNGELHRYCFICGGKIEVQNIEEVVDQDLQFQAERMIDQYLRTLGIEGTIELLERNSNQACVRVYFEILRKRGIIK